MRVLTMLVLALASATATAGAFRIGPVRLNIPAGFAGVVRRLINTLARTVAFVERMPASHRGTLQQISAIDFGRTPPHMTPKQRHADTDTYLQMPGGVTRRRTAFHARPPVHPRLDSRPASRVVWNGRATGHAMHGTMYCVSGGATTNGTFL